MHYIILIIAAVGLIGCLVGIIICLVKSRKKSAHDHPTKNWDAEFINSSPMSKDELKMFLVMAGPTTKNYKIPVVNANDMWFNQVNLLQDGDVATFGGDFVIPCPEDYGGMYCDKNPKMLEALKNASDRGATIIIRDDENITYLVFKDTKAEMAEIFSRLKKMGAKNVYRFCLPPSVLCNPGDTNPTCISWPSTCGNTQCRAVTQSQCETICQLDPHCSAYSYNDGSQPGIGPYQCQLFSTDSDAKNWGYSSSNTGTIFPIPSSGGGNPSPDWNPAWGSTFPDAVNAYGQSGWTCMKENFTNVGAGLCRSKNSLTDWPSYKNVPMGNGVNDNIFLSLFNTHDKFTTFYFIGKSHPKQYVLTTVSSFNPVWPDSLTAEMGIGLIGTIDNELIQGVVNREYIEFSRLATYVGKTGMGQYYSPTCDGSDPKALLPLKAVLKQTSFTWPVIIPKVTFCGPVMCGKDAFKKSVMIVDTNVKMTLGAEGYYMYGTQPEKGPTPGQDWYSDYKKNTNLDWGYWTRGNNPPARGDCSVGQGANKPCIPYGLDLVRKLIDGAKTYVKIGLFDGLLELCALQTPTCTPSTAQGPTQVTEEIKNALNRGVNIFVLQKLPSFPANPKCASITNAVDCKKASNCNWTADEKSCWSYGVDPENIPETYTQFYEWVKSLNKDDQFFIKFTNKSAFHWKFYMSDNSLCFSTQHPHDFFYNNIFGPTLGIELLMENCPNIHSYYDTVYNYYWDNLATTPKWKQDNPSSMPCAGGTNSDGCCSYETTNSSSSTCFPYREVV